MEDVLCGISAFRLYRTPPAVLGLFGGLPIARDHATRLRLAKQPVVEHVLGLPLHFLTDQHNHCSHYKNIKHHLWMGNLPQGAIWEVPGIGDLTSPEMTLLLTARTMTPVRLALCMYEICGMFSVYRLPRDLQEQITRSGTERLNRQANWQQVYNSKGAPTDLWTRPPLLSIDRLKEFAELNHAAYGGNNFYKAASMVVGVTRSPLEAEAALLLSAPRKWGGYGLGLETNHVIRLSRSARKIYQRDYCVADLYIESPDEKRLVAVECQGAAIHSGEVATASDANRTTALETMGISVVQITHADIRSAERLELIADHIAHKLGISLRARTPRMVAAERKMRAELPYSWTELSE